MVRNLDKIWTPSSCCNRCSRNLRGWYDGIKKSMPFGVPMIWREPSNHATDCYFCLTDTRQFSTKTKHGIKYSNVSSVIRPEGHTPQLPVPKPPSECLASTSALETDNQQNHDEFFLQPLKLLTYLLLNHIS
ncbi:hypothetical protein RF55_14749 [Lasius niger]|uniref:Uncharacterized protein n=1 Tax=Lasius niger TaxID=67767 RepID=A0A0J7K7W5_LASNI|nr:hypothetical protein RF55_14749 [Lasius niger]